MFVYQSNSISKSKILPGQYYDQETGLHYNYFRDYDPSTGRYVESDPIGLNGGRNPYRYAAANPIRYKDPRGLFYVGNIMGQQKTDIPGAEELAGVKCNNGKFDVEIYSKDKCLWKCLTKHEKRHIEDIKNTNGNICENRDLSGFRVLPTPDAYNTEKNWSELLGYQAELECLQKGSCSKCKVSIEARIEVVKGFISGYKYKLQQRAGQGLL